MVLLRYVTPNTTWNSNRFSAVIDAHIYSVNFPTLALCMLSIRANHLGCSTSSNESMVMHPKHALRRLQSLMSLTEVGAWTSLNPVSSKYIVLCRCDTLSWNSAFVLLNQNIALATTLSLFVCYFILTSMFFVMMMVANAASSQNMFLLSFYILAHDLISPFRYSLLSLQLKWSCVLSL